MAWGWTKKETKPSLTKQELVSFITCNFPTLLIHLFVIYSPDFFQRGPYVGRMSLYNFQFVGRVKLKGRGGLLTVSGVIPPNKSSCCL